MPATCRQMTCMRRAGRSCLAGNRVPLNAPPSIAIASEVDAPSQALGTFIVNCAVLPIGGDALALYSRARPCSMRYQAHSGNTDWRQSMSVGATCSNKGRQVINDDPHLLHGTKCKAHRRRCL